MPKKCHQFRAHIVAAIGRIDPSQIVFARDPETGSEFVRLDLRENQIEWVLRENGKFVRQAAMELGIDIEV